MTFQSIKVKAALQTVNWPLRTKHVYLFQFFYCTSYTEMVFFFYLHVWAMSIFPKTSVAQTNFIWFQHFLKTQLKIYILMYLKNPSLCSPEASLCPESCFSRCKQWSTTDKTRWHQEVNITNQLLTTFYIPTSKAGFLYLQLVELAEARSTVPFNQFDSTLIAI